MHICLHVLRMQRCYVSQHLSLYYILQADALHALERHKYFALQTPATPAAR